MASQPVGQVPGTLIDWAAGVIGIPAAVVRQQVIAESNGQPGAVSSTGAQGAFQFEPGTWSGLGCSGSPFNVNDGAKCYAKYMYQLVQQFHGNIRNALAAYNAGPGNLPAGYGYADGILAAAGVSSGASASGGTGNSGAGGGSGATLASAPSTCLVGPLPHTSFCLMSYGEARAGIGAALIVAGGLLALPGLIVLVAAGLAGTSAGQAAAAVTPVGRVLGAANSRAESAARPRRPPVSRET
jgi:hypothetical protein